MARLMLPKRVWQLAEQFDSLRYVVWWVEALPFIIFCTVAKVLPVNQSSRLGASLFRRFGPLSYKHQHIKDNLARAFPQWHPKQINTTARGVWANLGAMLGEYPHLGCIASQTDERIIIRMAPGSKQILVSKKPLIFVLAHLANWEIAAPCVTKLGISVTAVYSPLRNPLMNYFMQHKRQVLGCRFATKSNALRQLVREIRAGRSVALLTDQRVEGGEFIPFFGLNAQTSISPAYLALKLDCEIVPIQVERLHDCRFRVTFCEPLVKQYLCSTKHHSAKTLSVELNKLFESWIREHPDQWMCTKRRWPKDVSPVV